jgi:hypothetical protein
MGRLCLVTVGHAGLRRASWAGRRQQEMTSVPLSGHIPPASKMTVYRQM